MSLQARLAGIARLLQLALPSQLRFAHQMEDKQRQAVQTLGGEAVHLMAWAWQRRNTLGPDLETLVQGFAPACRPIARLLFSGWNQAVRASIVALNWPGWFRSIACQQ